MDSQIQGLVEVEKALQGFFIAQADIRVSRVIKSRGLGSRPLHKKRAVLVAGEVKETSGGQCSFASTLYWVLWALSRTFQDDTEKDARTQRPKGQVLKSELSEQGTQSAQI